MLSLKNTDTNWKRLIKDKCLKTQVFQHDQKKPTLNSALWSF